MKIRYIHKINSYLRKKFSAIEYLLMTCTWRIYTTLLCEVEVQLEMWLPFVFSEGAKNRNGLKQFEILWDAKPVNIPSVFLWPILLFMWSIWLCICSTFSFLYGQLEFLCGQLFTLHKINFYFLYSQLNF